MIKKIAVSACLIGRKCNFKGNDLLDKYVESLVGHNQFELVPFCPEDSVFGTPRPNLRIVGGDGYDVLDGRAKVIDENEVDVTDKQIQGAKNFLNLLQKKNVESAILMEGSPSCGSTILLKEEKWPEGGFKKGEGVACALLRRNGIQVLGSFDSLSINQFLNTKLNDYPLNSELSNLRDIPKFKELLADS